MVCDKCKKSFDVGNRPDGIPNGVTLMLRNGKSLTMCADCVMILGRGTKKQRNEFFKDLEGGSSNADKNA